MQEIAGQFSFQKERMRRCEATSRHWGGTKTDLAPVLQQEQRIVQIRCGRVGQRIRVYDGHDTAHFFSICRY